MEEGKGKVVDMQPNVNGSKENKQEKLSYEQLENIAHQLSEQTKQLYSKLQTVNMTNMFKRLDYLFKIVENGHAFKPDFLERCVEEIEEIITIPEEEDKEEDTKTE